MSDVKEGSVWVHTNGNVYEVLMITNKGSENPTRYPVTVVYKNRLVGTIWSRPLDEWARSFTLLTKPSQGV